MTGLVGKFKNLAVILVPISLFPDQLCGYSARMPAKDNTLGKDLAKMLKGGVIMDVVNVKQAVIAERAGACAVMALERVPSDIRRDGGVARMADPALIAQIQKAVSIPVMAKVRIGHTAEAKILEALKVDFIDESEVLTPANPFAHVDKTQFNVPFVCGATNLGEALRRIQEGASMIRTKGEAGTGNVVEAVRHLEMIKREILSLAEMTASQLAAFAKKERVSVELVKKVKTLKKLPVVTFVAGGVATPADAALLMEMGAEGVFVGSGIFKAKDPKKTASAIVQAVVHYNDPATLLKVSTGLGEAMPGLETATLGVRMQERGL